MKVIWPYADNMSIGEIKLLFFLHVIIKNNNYLKKYIFKK